MGDARYRRASGWTWRWWRGAILVMGPDRSPRRLDGAAAAAWAALERPATVAAIAPAGDASARSAAEAGVAALVALGAVAEEPCP